MSRAIGSCRPAWLAAVCVLAVLAVPVAADWNDGDLFKMHYPQLPDPFGWDVCLVDQYLADDFVCTETGPITDIHLWISWRFDDQGEVLEWEILICEPSAFAMGPGAVLWTWDGQGQVVVRPAGSGLQGWTCPRYGLIEPNNHQQFYQVNITEIPDGFVQEENQTYWLVVRAWVWEPVSTVPGWKTSVDHFQGPALWYDDMAMAWVPIETSELHDMAFVITGEGVELEACCWTDGTCTMEDPILCAALGGHPMGPGTMCDGSIYPCCLDDGSCVMADPFCCEVDLGGVPIFGATACAGRVEACCLDDGTCVMADPVCCELDLGGVPQGAGSQCTQAEACCLDDGTCLDLDPLCCDDLSGTPQGPMTACVDMIVPCCLPDGTCQDTDPLCCDDLGGVVMAFWGASCADVDCSTIKWLQPPDLTENGIDISLLPLRILADDFECTEPGLITDVHLFGSWKGDEVGEIATIELSFYTDDPVGPGGTDPNNQFSKPDEFGLLWQREFTPDQFTMEFYAHVEPGEYWWDTLTGELIPNGDSEVWMVNILINRDEAFLQQGTATDPTIYWLAVRVTPATGEFGWKTRSWPDHFMDDAVFDFGSELPRIWRELRYPPGHPYGDLANSSIDLAFLLTTETVELEPKWAQPPHPGGEGFDAASDLWWYEPPPKWEQLPNETLPGLHAHDWQEITGWYSWITLADDWICEGGNVTKLHWWGNYEVDVNGQEMRGAGIDHFHLSIHMCLGGDPYCVPGPEIVGYDVLFSDIAEQNTGLVNIEGSPIYLYEFDLPEPFPQEPGMHYWFDVTAAAVDPMNPPMWRWQEAQRDFTFLGWAPAAERQDPLPGIWQSIIWATDQFSDMAFRVISDVQLQPEEVNKVVADDFISDGRPIEALIWWGSYLDEIYAPDYPAPDDQFQIDGWMISFHHTEAGATCPPELVPADVPTVLGVYFAPVEAVRITPLFMQDCFGHGVYIYAVDLSQCCLLCSETDPRAGAVPPDPARPGRFLETAGFGYWLDIEAVVGVTWQLPACGYDDRILTGHLPSPNTPGGHFWGWHTSPGPAADGNALEEACTGRIVDFLPYPPDCWDYGDWIKQPWLCDDPIPEPVHMAFELLTPESIVWCLGDLDCSGGSPTFLDISYFVAALNGQANWVAYYQAQHGGASPPCYWLMGDYSYPHNGVDFLDIVPFANSIGQPCIPYVP